MNRSIAAGKKPLIDNFEVIKMLGKGSFATAFLVRDIKLNVYRVAKVLNSDLVGPGKQDDDYIELFLQEARALARITHDNVASIFVCGTTTDGRPYFIMEYLPGKDLRAVIADQKGTPIDILFAINLGIYILDGLSAAHQAGIVHRDIKPENIFIIPIGPRTLKAKVLDFGTFSMSGKVEMRGDVRIFRGTPRYSAPEQFLGYPATPACDIYSVGILLYEVLTGKTPFAHCNADDFQKLAIAHESETPRSIREQRPEVPVDLERLIFRFLEKNRLQRPQDAEWASQWMHDVKDGLNRDSTATHAVTFRNVEIHGGSIANEVSALPLLPSGRFKADTPEPPSEEPPSSSQRPKYDEYATDIDGEAVERYWRELAAKENLGPEPQPINHDEAVRYQSELGLEEEDLRLYFVDPPRVASRRSVELTTSMVAAVDPRRRSTLEAMLLADARDPFPSPKDGGTRALALRDVPAQPSLLPTPSRAATALSAAVSPVPSDSSENVWVESPLDAEEAAAEAAALAAREAELAALAPVLARPSLRPSSSPRPQHARTSTSGRGAFVAVLLCGTVSILAAVAFVFLRVEPSPEPEQRVQEAPALPPAPAASLAHTDRRPRPSASPVAVGASAGSASAAPSSSPKPKALAPAPRKAPDVPPAWLKEYDTSPKPTPSAGPRPSYRDSL